MPLMLGPEESHDLSPFQVLICPNLFPSQTCDLHFHTVPSDSFLLHPCCYWINVNRRTRPQSGFISFCSFPGILLALTYFIACYGEQSELLALRVSLCFTAFCSTNLIHPWLIVLFPFTHDKPI
uniref:Uncharacterized protein n=1 Tax=Arundo donax TaxID=35708 RepID=A0A0A9D046_ARUDO